MLTMAPSLPAGINRRARSVEHRKVPFSTMSTTVRQAFGLMSSAGTGKLPAALLIRTSTGPERGLGGIECGRDGVGVPDVAGGGERPAAGGLDGGDAGGPVLLVAAQDRHRRPQPGELGGDGFAEAGASSGDDHHHPVIGPRGQSRGTGLGWLGESGKAVAGGRRWGGAHGRRA